MMRKKICLALSVLFACWLGSAGAQSVVVDGVGADETAAQRDAVRNAVEQAAGTYLSSRTLVADGQTQLDEIYAQSQGYVTHTEILSRAQEAGVVRLRVRVEVDMSADSKLMSRLQTVAFLDDPRIAIVVLDAAGAAQADARDAIVEGALSERLIDMGFHHVMDAGQTASIAGSVRLAGTVQGGAPQWDGDARDTALDYLVLGRCDTHDYPVQISDGRGYREMSAVSSARADLSMRIVDYATGQVLGTFQATGQGVENDGGIAANLARQQAAAAAAEQLEQRFRHVAATPYAGLVVTVKAADLATARRFAADLRTLPGVENVFLRSWTDGKAVLELSSAQKPYTIVDALHARTKWAFFVSDATARTLTIALR